MLLEVVTEEDRQEEEEIESMYRGEEEGLNLK